MFRRFDHGMVSLVDGFQPTIAAYHDLLRQRIERYKAEGIHYTRADQTAKAMGSFREADRLTEELSRSRLEVPFSLILDLPPIPPQQIPLWYQVGPTHTYEWTSNPADYVQLLNPPPGQIKHPFFHVLAMLLLLTEQDVWCGMGAYDNYYHLSFFWNEDIRNQGSFLTMLTRKIERTVKMSAAVWLA